MQHIKTIKKLIQLNFNFDKYHSGDEQDNEDNNQRNQMKEIEKKVESIVANFQIDGSRDNCIGPEEFFNIIVAFYE